MQRQFDLVYAYLALAQRPGQRGRGGRAHAAPGARAGRGAKRVSLVHRPGAARLARGGAAGGSSVRLGRHDSAPRSPSRSAPRSRWWTRSPAPTGRAAEAMCPSPPPLFRARDGRAHRVHGRTPPHRRRASMTASPPHRALPRRSLAAGPAARLPGAAGRHRHRLSRRGRQPDPSRHRGQRGLPPARPAGGHVRPPPQRLGEPRGGDRLDPRRR